MLVDAVLNDFRAMTDAPEMPIDSLHQRIEKWGIPTMVSLQTDRHLEGDAGRKEGGVRILVVFSLGFL